MRKRIIISLVLVLVMLCSMTVYGEETSKWYDNAIENAVLNGLYNDATAKSLANEDLSRAEMATVINRAFGSTSKASLSGFTDVPKEVWYYDDMAKAVNMGIFKGSEGKLNPKSKITREETFTVLARAIKLTSTDLTVLGEFSDAVDISAWAKPEIAAMVKAGYINGSNSKLYPKGNITRAEFAQIMDNMIKEYINVAGTYTSVPSGNVLINTPGVTLKGATITGDLIIGDGVGNGEVTLDSVKVIGRTVIRGGGVNSIKIIGDSSMGTVIVTRVDGQVRVVVSGDANVQIIEIADGSDDVLLEGTISSVKVNAAEITITANNAQIGMVNIEAEGAKIAVGAGTTIDKIKLNATKASADVAGTVKNIEATKGAEDAGITTVSTAKIENIKTEAKGTTVTGKGKVTKVQANANDVKVETPNTSVSAGEGTSGVTLGGKAVKAGNTVTQRTGSSGGGGSSNSETPAGPVVPEKPELTIDYTNECITGYDVLTMEYRCAKSFNEYYTDVDWSAPGSLKSIISNKYSTYICCRYKETAETSASLDQWLSIDKRPSPPSGIETISANQGNNGKITMLSSANYQYKLYNADPWSDENIENAASTQTYEINNLAVGTYYVRQKATDSSFTSRATAVTVFNSGSVQPSAPSLLSARINADATKMYLQFDKTMSSIGLDKDDFRVYNNFPYHAPYDYNISSIGLKQGDSTCIELTISSTISEYPIGVAYTWGTTVANDGGVLATLSGQDADNMYLQVSLEQGTELSYGTIEMSSLEGYSYRNFEVGYIIASDGSTTAPDAGTKINTIENIKILRQYNFSITGDIQANNYLVVYTYDNKTNMINGFGKVEITEENIGKKCNREKNAFAPTIGFGLNETTQYALSFGSIGEAQTVTAGGINASDVTIRTMSGIQAYIVDTTDIAKTGGEKTFTLTLSGDENNGQTNGEYIIGVRIYPPTPLALIDESDSHRINVSGAMPGAKIQLFNPGAGSIYKDADANGCAVFEGLAAGNYYAKQTPTSGPGNGIMSGHTHYIKITD